MSEIINNKNNKINMRGRRFDGINIIDIILLAAAVLFFLGFLTVFSPCAAPDDGTWMSCHWAGMSLRGVAGVLMILEFLHALPVMNAGRKQGLDMAAVCLSVLIFFIPGRLIDICVMKTMRCHTVMIPAAFLCAGLIIILSCIDIYRYYKYYKYYKYFGSHEIK